MESRNNLQAHPEIACKILQKAIGSLTVIFLATTIAADETPPTRLPEVLTFVEAVYPKEARLEGIEADVRLFVDINQDGTVSDVALISVNDPEGLPLREDLAKSFAEAAQTAVRKFLFRPAAINQIEVAVRIEYIYRFRLDRANNNVIEKLDTGHATPSDEEPPESDQGYQTIVRAEPETVSVHTLSQRELTTAPGTFGDPVRVVENLPGMARSPYVLSLLLVRGSYPGDSSVYLDGVRVPLIFHFLGGPSIISPDFIKRIEFYPGNFSVRYGHTIAGVIEVETGDEMPAAWTGSADLNLFFFGAYTAIPISDDCSLKLAFRRSYYEATIPLAFKIAGVEGTTVLPVYYDYQARLDLIAKGRLQIFAFGSDDALTLETNSESVRNQVNLDAHTSFHRLVVQHLASVSDFTNRFVSHLGLDIIKADTGASSLDGKVFSIGVRDEVSWQAYDYLKLRLGIDVGLERYQYLADVPPYKNYIVPGANIGAGGFGGLDSSAENISIDRALDIWSLAAYMEPVWQPASSVTIIPSFRIQGYSFLKRFVFRPDPRLVIRIGVTDDTTLKVGAGLFSKLPSAYTLDPDYGNPDLDMEWAEHYSAGFEHSFTEQIMLDIQGFFIRRHDRVLSSKRLIGERGLIKRENWSNEGYGRAYGLEVLLRHELTDAFYGWLSYTLSRSEEVAREGEGLSPSRFDQTHILTVLASVRLGRGWELGGRFRLISGNPTTPRLDGTFVADRSRYIPYIGERYSDRLPLFHQLDIRIEKTWDFEKWMLSLYLDVQNIYFAKNQEAVVWDYRNRHSYGISGIPILPTLGLRGRF